MASSTSSISGMARRRYFLSANRLLVRAGVGAGTEAIAAVLHGVSHARKLFITGGKYQRRFVIGNPSNLQDNWYPFFISSQKYSANVHYDADFQMQLKRIRFLAQSDLCSNT